MCLFDIDPHNVRKTVTQDPMQPGRRMRLWHMTYAADVEHPGALDVRNNLRSSARHHSLFIGWGMSFQGHGVFLSSSHKDPSRRPRTVLVCSAPHPVGLPCPWPDAL